MDDKTQRRCNMETKGIDCIFYQKDGIERQASFVANWDVYFNEITDNYTTEDISLEDLFRLWAEKVIKEYPNGLIPITWGLVGSGIFEYMPFQLNDKVKKLGGYNFLTYFSYPLRKDTGEHLNLFDLYVVDKHWNKNKRDRSGFIQEYTHWKPSILQSHMYLPAFLEVIKNI